MEVFGFTVARTKSLQQQLNSLSSRGGWWRAVREPSIGAWQRNEEISADTVMANPAVYACCSMIAQDIAKCRLRLVSLDADGIWNETDSPSFSPVLRKPNAYQHTVSFVEQWVMSKLTNGNTYALKARD